MHSSECILQTHPKHIHSLTHSLARLCVHGVRSSSSSLLDLSLFTWINSTWKIFIHKIILESRQAASINAYTVCLYSIRIASQRTADFSDAHRIWIGRIRANGERERERKRAWGKMHMVVRVACVTLHRIEFYIRRSRFFPSARHASLALLFSLLCVVAIFGVDDFESV